MAVLATAVVVVAAVAAAAVTKQTLYHHKDSVQKQTKKVPRSFKDLGTFFNYLYLLKTEPLVLLLHHHPY